MSVKDRVVKAMDTPLDDIPGPDLALLAAAVIVALIAFIAAVATYFELIGWACHRWHAVGGWTAGVTPWLVLVWALLRYALRHDDAERSG